MSGKQALDRKLEQLRELRANPLAPAATEALRRALKDRSNYAVSKAAALIAEMDRRDLVPELTAAFYRFLENPAKSDPQCWAKHAIAKVLKDWECEESALFLRGIRHVQLEPSWGGRQDSAAALRGACAFGLLNCRSVGDLEILRCLVDLLADADPSPRMDAARAVAALGRPEGALLLRLKIHAGDERAEVTGQCMAAYVALDPVEGAAFVAGYLEHPNEDLVFEAAAALGESKEPAAVEALRRRLEHTLDQRLRKALLLAIGATRQEAAIEYLLSLLPAGNAPTAAAALEALGPACFRDEIRARVEDAVRSAGSAHLEEVWRKVRCS
ncbi:MAG: HEAT repeat domain-containing protein [Bryobacterales bacterium]|nr:HEAT repeat domain-containing protein [Bryobacterales bacterium]